MAIYKLHFMPYPYESVVTAQAWALEMVCFGKLFMVSHKRTHTPCRKFEHLRKKIGIICFLIMER